RAHPEYVAGTRRADTWLMRDVPGALSKMGAEAVQAVALPDGRALAFKVEDGSLRALGPVLARALRLMGVDGPVVDRLGAAPLTGGAEVVGEVRAVFCVRGGRCAGARARQAGRRPRAHGRHRGHPAR